MIPNSSEGYISFEEARKIVTPLSFDLMLKPVGSLCNLHCNYCYYDNKYPVKDASSCMSNEILEESIKKYCSSIGGNELHFDWHGGEPLIAGLDFYKRAVELQRKYSCGRRVINTIQTNGTLLTRDWAMFFKENDFLVGVSIDGPEQIHDSFRLNHKGRSSFREVLRGILLLNNEGVEFNTLTTINKSSEGHGLEIYSFLKSLGAKYLQFNPVLEFINERGYIVPPENAGKKAPWSINSVGFGEFLCDIFDYWVKHDVGQIFVNHFDSALAKWCGLQSGLCVYNKTCSDNLLIENNGDVYSCDHFVYSKNRLGNVAIDSFPDLIGLKKHTDFKIDKSRSLGESCKKCKWLFACCGGCPKHRLVENQKEWGTNGLCEGFILFFEHVAPYMAAMKELLQNKLPPALIMSQFNNI